MNKKLFILLGIIVGITFSSNLTLAAESFYTSKTIRLLVGSSPGGGFDTAGRLVARHIGKYIPGNPTVIVENNPGAGGVIVANTIFKKAKPDGLTFGLFNGGLMYSQLCKEPGIEFDATKFEYLGGPFRGGNVVGLNKASGIKNIEQWMASKRPLKFGGSGEGAGGTNTMFILKEALGLPIHMIPGYRGSSEVRLAVESGELDGTAIGWTSMRVTWRNDLEKGNVFVVLQIVPKAYPDLPNVPLAINHAKTEEGRQLIEYGLHKQIPFSRPFVMPPGTPKERMQILRKAFQECLRDKELLAEAEKAKLDVEPVTDEEMKNAVVDLFKMNPAMIAKLRKLMFESL
jgi:tripartite-type tricarboxylate transporter receptor subunit TctC